MAETITQIIFRVNHWAEDFATEQYMNGTRCSYISAAFKNNVINQEEYETLKEYYGYLWHDRKRTI
jgi:hypothetical protein